MPGLLSTGRWQWGIHGEELTHFSSPSKECHGLVDREPFHLRCLAAVCGCAPGRDCLCPVLAAYARRCAQEGALPSWRNRTFCREPA